MNCAARLHQSQSCDLLIDSYEAADLSNIDTTVSFSEKGQRDRDSELLCECAVADRYSHEITHTVPLCPAILVDDVDAILHRSPHLLRQPLPEY